MRVVRSRFVSVVGLAVLLLWALVACERPFQENAEIAVPGAGEPTINDLTPAFSTPEGALEITPAPGSETQPTVEGGNATPVEGSPAENASATEEPAAPELPTNEAGQPIHVVRSGDTIGGIAVLYGVEIEDIAAANPQILDINVLDIGQEVIIPPAGFATTPVAPTEAAPSSGDGTGEASATAEVGERVHVVRAGDTLYSIGLLYGFTVEELQEYNSLSDPNVLKIGDEVRIPPPATGE